MPPTNFAAFLIAEGWQLVYSFANICEVAVVRDLLETRSRLQVLDRIPHTNIIALPRLRCSEFAAAVDGYTNACEQHPVNPYVNSWYETYAHPGQANYQDLLVNYTLVDQVLPIVMYNPDVCRNLPQHTLVMQNAVADDREVTNAARRNRTRFEGGVQQALIHCGIPFMFGRSAEFANWVRADARRCPGWRFFNEVYFEFCSNTQDQVQRGDVPDFSHISCVPYVEAITLDRRMAGYARMGARRLHTENPAITYEARIFSDTEAWLESI